MGGLSIILKEPSMASSRTLATISLGLTAFVASVTLAGPVLLWETTFSVTTELEGADELVVDAAGNSIVAGYLPIEGDFFVLKFDAAGGLLWSRIIGGQSLDWVNGLAVDDTDDIYLAGRTRSADFPIAQAFQDTMNGTSDAFMMKLDGNTGSIIFSTFFGGDRGEWAHDIAIGTDGAITIVGQTDSINLPLVDPIQDHLTLIDCFCADAFVARFSPDGATQLFGTYLGGTYDDVANEVTVDTAGNTTIAGRTESADFPTQSATQPVHGGGDWDAFVARISAAGALEYSTFLGGSETETVEGLAVDPSGNVYLAGSTRSVEYPTTPSAFQTSFVGGLLACEVPYGQDRNCPDMFVTKLGTDGSLHYSTFIGGLGTDEPRNIVVDALGRAVVVGYTHSYDFPLNAPFGTVVALRLNAIGSDLDYIISHWTPGSNAGSAVALLGNDIFIATSVGLPYDAYLARYSGPTSPADIDGDGTVGVSDFLIVLSQWGPCIPKGECTADIDGSGAVDLPDLLAVLADWDFGP